MVLHFLFPGCFGWREFAANFVQIAPGPLLPGHRRTHHWMLCLMEVFGRVLSRGGVTTADVATRQALTECDPLGTCFQALFAADRFAKWCKVCFGTVF